MRAAVMHGRKDIRIEELPRPVPGPDELVLEVHAAGVCGTDLGEYLKGPSMFPIPGPHPITEHKGPMIPGHEFGGRIVEKGADVDGFAEGELLASGAGISCGTCF
jgi:(R,R)-butanediol dehydrogenase/meso-butanediol dehydrogenase/diacetyl reductase